MLRRIPNDYKYKRRYFLKHASDIEVLFLGNSHAYYGINPVYINRPSMNLAHPSQSLDIDYQMLAKYGSRVPKLKFVVLPISYFSFNLRLQGGIEDWRVKNYNIYYSIRSTYRIKDYAELFTNKLSLNIDRVIKYYKHNEPQIYCDSNGWGTTFNSAHNQDLVETGILAAQRHNKKDAANTRINSKALQDIIDLCQKTNSHLILYTPPAYYTYIQNINKNQLDTVIQTAYRVASNNKNVRYFNFLQDQTFVAGDFYDADHLNEIGAKKLSLKLDSCIRFINY